jgi:hypothetical protein
MGRISSSGAIRSSAGKGTGPFDSIDPRKISRCGCARAAGAGAYSSSVRAAIAATPTAATSAARQLGGKAYEKREHGTAGAPRLATITGIGCATGGADAGGAGAL